MGGQKVKTTKTMVGGTHYLKSIQPWDVIESWFGKEGFAIYLAGTAIKYLCRFRDKNGIEDLKKARHFIDRLIELEETK